MSDLFHPDRPRAQIDRAIATILHSKHIGQLLTKRPDVMRDYFEELHTSGRWRQFKHPLYPGIALYMSHDTTWENTVLPRLWLGCSAERQQEADQRRSSMLCLAKHHGFTTFVSYEPAIGPVDWTGWEFLKWFIAGGMSGPTATPAHPDWFRAARDFCEPRGIPFFFKQWGEWAPAADHDPKLCKEQPTALHADGSREYQPSEAFKHLALREPGWAGMCRLGRNEAGRLLDGKLHNAFPEVA
jgi:protein gp37